MFIEAKSFFQEELSPKSGIFPPSQGSYPQGGFEQVSIFGDRTTSRSLGMA